jgi:hypothetical protein
MCFVGISCIHFQGQNDFNLLFYICLLNFLLQGEVVYVLKRLTLSAEEICSFVIGDACGDVYNPYHEWEVVFPPVPKPVVTPLAAPTVRTYGVLQ